jgi:serine/threonine protein kinase
MSGQTGPHTWTRSASAYDPPVTDFAALREGSVFAGRYRIERLLKSGGMGAVYVVRHVKTGAQLALKVMRPEIVANAGMRERFAQEAQVASLIESRSVVVVTDADIDEATGIPFLVMELLRGNELGELLGQRGRFSPGEVVDYITQTARALDKAHRKRIVHRDLKPENLFLEQGDDDEPPRIKILDFGIAKIVESTVHAVSTQGGGTPLYMAPEQLSRGRQIGPWTDIWALGLIAYVLLVGKPFWEAEAIAELYGEILNSEREPPSARAARLGVTLPFAFDSWFARCVVNEVGSRFQRAGEAGVALAAALGVSRSSGTSENTENAPSLALDPAPQPAATTPMLSPPLVAPTAPMQSAAAVSAFAMLEVPPTAGSTARSLSDSGAERRQASRAPAGGRRPLALALVAGGLLIASGIAVQRFQSHASHPYGSEVSMTGEPAKAPASTPSSPSVPTGKLLRIGDVVLHGDHADDFPPALLSRLLLLGRVEGQSLALEQHLHLAISRLQRRRAQSRRGWECSEPAIANVLLLELLFVEGPAKLVAIGIVAELDVGVTPHFA